MADDAERCRLPPIGRAVQRSPLPRRPVSSSNTSPTAPYRGRLWDLSVDPPGIRFEESDVGVNVAHRFRADGRLLAPDAPRRGRSALYDPATGTGCTTCSRLEVVKDAWVDLHPTAPFVAVSSYFHHDVLVRDLRTGELVARVDTPWPGGGFVYLAPVRPFAVRVPRRWDGNPRA